MPDSRKMCASEGEEKRFVWVGRSLAKDVCSPAKKLHQPLPGAASAASSGAIMESRPVGSSNPRPRRGFCERGESTHLATFSIALVGTENVKTASEARGFLFATTHAVRKRKYTFSANRGHDRSACWL